MFAEQRHRLKWRTISGRRRCCCSAGVTLRQQQERLRSLAANCECHAIGAQRLISGKR